MSSDPVSRSQPLDPSRANACDDAPVSHGQRPKKVLRISIADDHPVVLTGIEMVLSSFADPTCSVVAKAENARTGKSKWSGCLPKDYPDDRLPRN